MGLSSNIGTLLPDRTNRNNPNFRPYRDRSSIMEVMGAQFSLAMQDTTSSFIYRKMEREVKSAFSNSKTLQPEEIQERFPELTDINEPMDETTVESLAKQERKRNSLRKTIQEGDPDSLLQKASGTLIGFGTAAFLDPVAQAVGIGVGKGLTALIGKAVARGGSSGAATKFAQFLNKRKTATAATEGAVGNVLEESALRIPLSKEEKQDVDTLDALMTAAAGGFILPVAARGVSKGFSLLRHGRNGEAKSNKAAVLSEGYMESGKKVNIDPYIRAEARKELPSMKEELNVAREAGDEAKVKDLEEKVETAERMEEPNRLEEAQRANSMENDIHYDADVQQRAEVDAEEPLVSFDEEIVEDLNVVREQVNDLESRGLLDESSKKEIEESFSFFDKVEDFKTMTREAFTCIR